jgi:predicted PurR-regulated permease PerM
MVFVALFLAVALEPAVHFLEKRGWKRGLATGLVFLALFVLVVLFLMLLVPLFVNQVNSLIDQLPVYIENVTQQLSEWFNIEISTESLQQEAAGLPDLIAGAGGTILGGVVSITTGIFSFLFFVATVALFAFYMVADLPRLQRTVLSTMNPKRQRNALHIWDVAVEKMGGYIYSRLILALLSGMLTALFLTILDVPFAVSLGVWVGVLSQFIPVVGTYLAAILPAVVALSSRGVGTTLWVVVYFLAYQQIENYFIAPRITERTMEIHPAVSIGAIIIGSALLGPIGVILALPMAGIIQALISETRSQHAVILDEHPEAAPAK